MIGLLIPIKSSTAVTFGVTIGDTFTYECIAASRSIVWGTESSDSEGFELDDHEFAVGTSVDVEVANIISDSVFYTVSKDGYVAYYGSDAVSLLSTIRFNYGIFITMLHSYVISMEWNQTLMDEPPGMPIDLLFIEIDSSTWTNLINIVDSMIELFSTFESTSNLVMDASYNDNGSVFSCNFHLSGTLDETYTPTSPYSQWTDYSDDVSHIFRFAYEKNTGVLLGMHLSGSMTGTANGTNYEVSIDSQVEREDFDFTESLTPTGNISGYSNLIAVTSIVTMFVITTIIRRKKK